MGKVEHSGEVGNFDGACTLFGASGEITVHARLIQCKLEILVYLK
jgi:hypothetical protein